MLPGQVFVGTFSVVRKKVVGSVDGTEDALRHETFDVVSVDEIVDEFVVIIASAYSTSHLDVLMLSSLPERKNADVTVMHIKL